MLNPVRRKKVRAKEKGNGHSETESPAEFIRRLLIEGHFFGLIRGVDSGPIDFQDREGKKPIGGGEFH